MDFSLTPEQELLQSSARAFLAERCDWDQVRRLEKDEAGYAPEIWREAAGLGWLGLALPAEYEGSGLSFLDLTLLAMEMGRVLLPGPYLSSTLTALAVSAHGADAQRSDILPRVAAGDLVLAPAIFGSGLGWNRRGESVRAQWRDGRYLLDGISLFVPWAAAAQKLLVLADLDQEAAAFLVDVATPGVALAALPTLGGDKQYEVRLAGATAERLGTAAGEDLFEFLWSRGALLTSAFLTGAGEAALELTVEYAKQRVQFGQPIGSFQAIQHRCAEMKVDVDGARWVTLEAAWRLSQGQRSGDWSVAKAYVSDALRRLVTHAHQVHGAIGFSEEHPMPLFSRRVKALEAQFGDSTSHRAELAAILMDD
jgi:alkylation response protein AidB-like acyl-CoA dehydrogenase